MFLGQKNKTKQNTSMKNCLIYIYNSFANQFLSSSFVGYSRKLKQIEEIIYFN